MKHLRTLFTALLLTSHAAIQAAELRLTSPIDFQVYNFANDIGETKNLAAAMPEKVAEMKALLEKLITEGRSTPGAVQKNDVEVKRYPAKPVAESKQKAKGTK